MGMTQLKGTLKDVMCLWSIKMIKLILCFKFCMNFE